MSFHVNINKRKYRADPVTARFLLADGRGEEEVSLALDQIGINVNVLRLEDAESLGLSLSYAERRMIGDSSTYGLWQDRPNIDELGTPDFVMRDLVFSIWGEQHKAPFVIANDSGLLFSVLSGVYWNRILKVDTVDKPSYGYFCTFRGAPFDLT